MGLIDPERYCEFLRRSVTYVTTVDVIRLKHPPMRMSIGTRIAGHVERFRNIGTMYVA